METTAATLIVKDFLSRPHLLTRDVKLVVLLPYYTVVSQDTGTRSPKKGLMGAHGKKETMKISKSTKKRSSTHTLFTAKVKKTLSAREKEIRKIGSVEFKGIDAVKKYFSPRLRSKATA